MKNHDNHKNNGSPRKNEGIRNNRIVVVGEGPPQKLTLDKALEYAESRGMDLVEVGFQDGCSICKILDYGKFMYEKEKSQKHEKKNKLKEVQMGCTISPHDLETKLKKLGEWLAEGDAIKIVVKFKGRQMQHKEIGFNLLEQIRKHIPEGHKLDNPKMAGRNLITRVV